MKSCVIEFSPALESVDQLEQVLRNSYHQYFYHRKFKNADGSPQRWRVNGQLKRWKIDRSRMRLPIKHGLYAYDAIESLEDFNAYLAVGYKDSTDREHGVMNPL